VTRSIYRPPWRVDLDVREGVVPPTPIAVLARAIWAVLDEVHAPAPASIGLILGDDAELAALNAEHMGQPGPTDVLSFPLLPPEVFGPGAHALEVPRPPGSRVHLGDIVVSVERAIDHALAGGGGQTGDVRWSPADELRLLVTHGTLHICGWDHATRSDERLMRALEQRLLGTIPGHPQVASSGDPSR
jgi:probable rRNA maturation factor